MNKIKCISGKEGYAFRNTEEIGKSDTIQIKSAHRPERYEDKKKKNVIEAPDMK